MNRLTVTTSVENRYARTCDQPSVLTGAFENRPSAKVGLKTTVRSNSLVFAAQFEFIGHKSGNLRD